jgi:hypothetical protein
MAGEPGPVFVVGTGRCGSTLLSEMLGDHPEILSLSEFFASVAPFRFVPSHWGGDTGLNREEFARSLLRPRPETDLLLRYRAESQELLYPLDGPGKFSRESGIPPIGMITLPHLLNDVADVDRMIADLPVLLGARLPSDRVGAAEAFGSLFALLCEHFDKRVWVERSGGSLYFVGELKRMFPDARFVHIFRDGRECALSMAQHPAFRLSYFISLVTTQRAQPPFSVVWEDADELAAAISECLGTELTRQVLLDQPIEPAWFGLNWSNMVTQGLTELADAGSSRVLHVPFEELVVDPVPWVSRLVDFIGVEADPPWIGRQCNKVRHPISRWASLNGPARRRLDRACAVGTAVLSSLRGSSTGHETPNRHVGRRGSGVP